MHFSMGGELDITLSDSVVRVCGNNRFNCKGNYVIALPEGMTCPDGKREFSFTVNGSGPFKYVKDVK